jgi:hypothetical protein
MCELVVECGMMVKTVKMMRMMRMMRMRIAMLNEVMPKQAM